jgi:hypothetical protein
MAARTNSSRVMGVRSTKTTPSGKSAATSPATAMASRVLPIPPGPVIVSRRTSLPRNRSLTLARSSARPMSGVSGTGRGSMPSGAGVSAMSFGAGKGGAKRSMTAAEMT